MMSEEQGNQFSQSQYDLSLTDRQKPRSYTMQGVRVSFPYVAYPSQVALMDKIIRSLRNKQNCLLESPTGSGKSLALLCAALAWQRKEIDNILALEAAAELAGSILNENDQSDKNKVKIQKQNPGCSSDKGLNDVFTLKEVSSHLLSSVSSPIYRTSSNDEEDSAFQPQKRFRFSNSTPQNIIVSKREMDLGNYVLLQQPQNNQPVVVDLTQDSNVQTVSSQAHHSKSNKQPANFRTHRPKIFFCTRTHKQVKQITQELSRSSYSDARMCILSSRENTCIHPDISKQPNKNEGCQELLKDPKGIQCSLYRHLKTRGISQYVIKDNGLQTAWDLEDMVALGKKLHYCPYFGLRELMQDSDIIFCPYNYLTDPLIRSSMDISLKGQVVILDEGHNIEDCAREAASFSVNQDSIDEAIKDLESITVEERRLFAKVLSNMSDWISRYSKNMTDYNEFDRSGKVWVGHELVAMMTDFGAGPENLSLLRRQLESLSSDDSQVIPVAAATQQILKGLLFTLEYLYREKLKFMPDYRCVIVKTFVKRQHSDPFAGWRTKNSNPVYAYTYTLNLWCLNPGVCFSDFHDVHSLIVTSGTLCPMASFQSELALQFPIAFEANHVIRKSQVWVGTIGCGPSKFPLKAVYQNTESLQFQDELGEVVLQVCQTVPHGVLCFFPSYSNLDKLKARWQLTGLMDKIESIKLVVVEPRASNKAQFEEILEDFYSAIEEGGGALFLAVYRGKVSEGLNFSDDNARAVITIGIPYPNLKDIQVDLKQKYNNEHCRSRALMNGRDWYEAQAFRALNQALGRCIRHKGDWGALILVDQRFQTNFKYAKSLSKWVRNELCHYEHFSEAVDSLKYFTNKVQSITDLANITLSSNAHNNSVDQSVVSASEENVTPCGTLQSEEPSTLVYQNSIEEKENISTCSNTEPVQHTVYEISSSPELF